MAAKKLKAHPAAEAWPMLNGDELPALVDDIAANGLRQPIVLDVDGLILDGRNRYEACRLAEVEPTFTTYDGDDPVGFVLSSNEHRRHMTKGQRAIAIARTLNYSSGITQTAAADRYNVSQAMIGKAAMVLKYAPDLADHVLAGKMDFTEAYDKAKKAKEAVDPKEVDDRHSQLPEDLITRIAESELSLDDAWTMYKGRRTERIEEQRDACRLLRRALDLLVPEDGRLPDDEITAWVERMTGPLLNKKDKPDPTTPKIDATQIDDAIATLQAIRKELP